MAEGNKSPTYQLVAEKVGQDTIAWLREQREDANASWREISLTLWSAYSLNVTEVTLRKWWADAHFEQAATT